MNNLKVFPFIRKIHCFSIVSLIAFNSLTACSPDSSNQTSKSAAKENSASEPAGTEISKVGEASWYGPGFEGQKTASGEIFMADRIMAASPDLPLGSKAEVTNLENNKKTEVRISDRGPYAKGRILDLSQGAAKELGMINKGKARVKVVVKHKPKKARKNKVSSKRQSSLKKEK